MFSLVGQRLSGLSLIHSKHSPLSNLLQRVAQEELYLRNRTPWPRRSAQLPPSLTKEAFPLFSPLSDGFFPACSGCCWRVEEIQLDFRCLGVLCFGCGKVIQKALDSWAFKGITLFQFTKHTRCLW